MNTYYDTRKLTNCSFRKTLLFSLQENQFWVKKDQDKRVKKFLGGEYLNKFLCWKKILRFFKNIYCRLKISSYSWELKLYCIMLHDYENIINRISSFSINNIFKYILSLFQNTVKVWHPGNILIIWQVFKGNCCCFLLNNVAQ